MYKAPQHRNGPEEIMDIPYEFPQEDYALAILTHAAMQTSDNSNSSYKPAGATTTSSSLTSADTSGTLPSITNHRSNVSQEHQNRTANLLKTSTLDHLGGYTSTVPLSRGMETMSYSQSNGLGRLSPYTNPGYQGIGAQISANYASNLGILNAESYDDGRHTMSAQQTASMRLKHQTHQLPFGIMDHPRIQLDDERRTESDEMERGTKKRRKHKIDDAQVADEEEEARKKARGRPRVDTKDETAADRRRTQIRMAQRAYRSRKETTITSLEKQVQDLRGTNEEMSNIFISLYDFAVGRGLLQREPEFGQQLQSTTERFLALAKASGNEDGSMEESHLEENVQHSEPEPGPRKRNTRASPKKTQKDTPQESEPAVQPWGGYTITKEDSPIEEIAPRFNQQIYGNKISNNVIQVITRPTEDNASFPFEFTDLQQYRVELPSVESFSHNFLPYSQPSMPITHSYNEFSFARRIHRGALEKAVRFLALEDPPKHKLQEVFGFSLMYMTKDQLLSKIQGKLESSGKDTLQDWRMPFLHTGGSGTFYPIHDEVNNELMPKFRTGFSMGPFSPRISEVQESLQDDMRCNVPGFGGDFFDANDVEGYLQGRGLSIPPAADFITAEIDLSEITSPQSIASSESALSSLSPLTPQSPPDHGIAETSSYSYNFDFSKPEGKAFPFPLGYADWENNASVREASNIDPIFSTMPVRSFGRVMDGATAKSGTSELPSGEKRLFTINVKVLLDEILSHAVCLGRAPGFRPADVNASIIAAIKAGFKG